MQKSSLDRLRHIRDECLYLESRTARHSKEQFLSDEDLKRAFVRSLEIIGEATKQIPAEFREQHSDLPWRLMSGMRDRLIHDYGGVDYDIVWQTSTEDVPSLLLQGLKTFSGNSVKGVVKHSA